LGVLEEGWSVARACRALRISRTAVSEWIKEDQTFKLEVEAAQSIGTEILEDEAMRRASKGVMKPIYQSGILVGYKREFSDTLLMFVLRGRNPQKYNHDGVGLGIWDSATGGPKFVLNNAPMGVKPPDEKG